MVFQMTVVASALYDVAKYPEPHGDDIFDWFRDENHVNKMNQYNLSKLIQLYTVVKLSAVIASSGAAKPNLIVLNSLDPCFCKTGLSGGLNGASKILFKIFEGMAARTAEEGSRLVVQAASAGQRTHGLYMRGGKVQEYDPAVTDEKNSIYLWDLLCKKLEGLQPSILQNLK